MALRGLAWLRVAGEATLGKVGFCLDENFGSSALFPQPPSLAGGERRGLATLTGPFEGESGGHRLVAAGWDGF